MMISVSSEYESNEAVSFPWEWEELFTPSTFLLCLVWFVTLIGGAFLFTATTVSTKPKRKASTPRRRDRNLEKSHWKLFRSHLSCRPTFYQFLKKLPRRIWNFYIDAFLIPAYRPEWGKYSYWSFNSPERPPKSVEDPTQSKGKPKKKKHKPAPVAHDHSQCKRIKINVNGTIFETQLRTLNKFPNTLLGNPLKREKHYDPQTRCYFFDRMPSSFEAILYFYQSGGYLRRPENVHRDEFYSDAEFYEIPKEYLESFKVEEGVVDPVAEEHDMPNNLLQRKIWLLFDYPESSIQARLLAFLSVFVIVLSIVVFCIETVGDFREDTQPALDGDEATVREFDQIDIGDPIFFTETICSIWFTVELVARFFSSPGKWDFMRSSQNLIDLISVLPYFLTISTAKREKSFGFLRVIRLVRVFRIFKLSRHSRGLKILGLTLKSSLSALFLLIFFVILGVILFSSCLYFAEQGHPDTKFRSIPDGFWFTVITMTTIGYGDVNIKVPHAYEYDIDVPQVVPLTIGGKIVGSLCAIAGVLVIALPVPVIVNNFNRFYHQSMAEQEFTFTKTNHVDCCAYRPGGGQADKEKEWRVKVETQERKLKEND